MSNTRIPAAAGLLVAAALNAAVASAQSYPNKPVHFIAAAAGSLLDITARLIAQEITGPLGQPVVVENRPAALIGEGLARSAPDGYTVGFAGGAIWLAPLLQKTSYDPIQDFAPLTLTTTSPLLVVVHPSLPVKSVKELIALAKARPGQLNYASGPTGGGGHLSGALFTSMGGVNIVRIPYKGSAEQAAALISGESQLSFFDLSVMPHVKAGKMRALAVTSRQPSPLVPGMPTVSASGLPDYESISILGMLAPAGTPGPVMTRLNQEIVRVLTRPDLKERLFNAGVIAGGSTPEEFAAILKADIAKWGKVIRDAGIKLE